MDDYHSQAIQQLLQKEMFWTKNNPHHLIKRSPDLHSNLSHHSQHKSIQYRPSSRTLKTANTYLSTPQIKSISTHKVQEKQTIQVKQQEPQINQTVEKKCEEKCTQTSLSPANTKENQTNILNEKIQEKVINSPIEKQNQMRAKLRKRPKKETPTIEIVEPIPTLKYEYDEGEDFELEEIYDEDEYYYRNNNNAICNCVQCRYQHKKQAEKYQPHYYRQHHNNHRFESSNNSSSIEQKRLEIEQRNNLINQRRSINKNKYSRPLLRPLDAVNPLENDNKQKISCNCKKSQCLKLYCDCFNAGLICGNDCNCEGCSNDLNSYERKDSVIRHLYKNPQAFQPKVLLLQEEEKSKVKHVVGCKCTKSQCMKKYCECFSAGVDCNQNCQCEDCENIQTFEESDEDLQAQQLRSRSLFYMPPCKCKKLRKEQKYQQKLAQHRHFNHNYHSMCCKRSHSRKKFQ